MFKRLDHVGIVVADIDASLHTYQNQLGFALLERVEIPEQKVVAAFLDGGNSTIELISPTDAESGTARYLANKGEGTHHICYEVDDIVAALAELAAPGRAPHRREAPPGRARAGGVRPPQGDPRDDDRDPAEEALIRRIRPISFYCGSRQMITWNTLCRIR